MAATSIQFIQNPPYSVDFCQYSKRQPLEAVSFASRVKSAVVAPLVLLKVVFASVAKAGYVTLSYSGASFKHIVLGYYGQLSDRWRPNDVYLVVFKVVFWVAAMGWCFAATTARLLYQHIQSAADDRSLLSHFAGNEMDPAHIVTHDLEIDVSGVPAQVTVNCLLKMFDEINFANPDQPGYMAPASRKEWDTEYPVAELKKSLEEFVDNVNQRVAFLGTPPAHDTPRLWAFYQQIEDAVRFSIQKSNQDLFDFWKENGQGPYQELSLQRYKNLLEDRARIPLMLAIAGKRCGARYMGEAMELYDDACKSANAAARGTLRDALIEILAKKRQEIAREHIQKHVAKKNSAGYPIPDTHDYTNYMSSLGKILAIPGTAHVIEHLVQELNCPHFLELFFKDYTVDRIIETVQDEVKKSQVFREKIIDWLKTQPGTWQPAEIPALEQMIADANPVLGDNKLAEDFPFYKSFQTLRGLIANLKPPLLPHADWDVFLLALFTSGEKWLVDKYPEAKARVPAKNDIQGLFSAEQLGPDLIAKTKEAIAGNWQLSIEPFTSRLLMLQKRQKLCAITRLNPDTAMRVIEGKKPLQQALEEQRLQAQGDEFVGSLDLENITNEGLPREMLEWVLVSQGILLTQAGE